MSISRRINDYSLVFVLAQKSEEKKKVVLNEKDEDDSDDDDEPGKKLHLNIEWRWWSSCLEAPIVSKEEEEKVNDDLLYDPDEEAEDEKWMANERLK